MTWAPARTLQHAASTPAFVRAPASGRKRRYPSIDRIPAALDGSGTLRSEPEFHGSLRLILGLA